MRRRNKRGMFSVVYEGGKKHNKTYGEYATIEEAIEALHRAEENGEADDCGGLFIVDPDGYDVEF